MLKIDDKTPKNIENFEDAECWLKPTLKISGNWELAPAFNLLLNLSDTIKIPHDFCIFF